MKPELERKLFEAYGRSYALLRQAQVLDETIAAMLDELRKEKPRKIQ